MPLVAAAVCPHPPLIVPEVAAGAAPELDDLRAACDAAVATLVAVRPDCLITVGTGPRTIEVDSAGGSFAAYGVRAPVTGLGPRERAAVSGLPLSLTVGAWLLERAEGAAAATGQVVAGNLPVDECAALGEELAARAPRVALLVMGDGSACRGDKAPGYTDPRAEPYDEAVAAALRDADFEALLGLDERVSTELMVAGRAAWQVLAGATRASHDKWGGALKYVSAPYGVAYFVATWLPL